jgi:tRNA pseudouridine55 synthase
VERAPRRVRIDALELLDWTSPLLELRVACGKGTYVRSLAADLGEALGCGGRLDALVRTRLGPFTLADAVPWAAIRDGDAGVLAAAVLPTDRAVGHLPAVRLEPAEADRLRHGQALAGRASAPGPCRLYAGATFVGIGEADGERLRPLRLLNADHPSPRPVSR